MHVARFRTLRAPIVHSAAFVSASSGAAVYSAGFSWIFAVEERGNAPLTSSIVSVRLCAFADPLCGHSDASAFDDKKQFFTQPRTSSGVANYTFATVEVSGTANSATITGLPLAQTACLVVRAKSELGFSATR